MLGVLFAYFDAFYKGRTGKKKSFGNFLEFRALGYDKFLPVLLQI